MKPKLYKWVIVGAGPVGTHLALSLLRSGKVSPKELAILDPLPPLELWRRRTRNCGLTYLRSASVQHIGASSAELDRFQREKFPHPSPSRGRVRTPRLEIFNAHCESLLKESCLLESWMACRLLDVQAERHGYQLNTCEGTLQAEAIVLSPGLSWKPSIPEWLEPVANRCRHLLDPDFDRKSLASTEKLAVLGGGMSAVQAALSFCDEKRVTLLTRSPIKVSEFDESSSWMAPMNQRFLRAPAAHRIEKMNRVRRPGTVNKEVKNLLQAAQKSDKIDCLNIENPKSRLEGQEVVLEFPKATVRVEQVLLGIGFRRRIHPLIQKIGTSLEASFLKTGHPQLEHSLQWLPNLYVVGGGAELEIGPTAPNLLGARLAAQRLLSAAFPQKRKKELVLCS